MAYRWEFLALFLPAEKFVWDFPAGEKEDQGDLRTPHSPAEVVPSSKTRLALAERLLERPRQSLEEADGMLNRASFQMSPSQPH